MGQSINTTGLLLTSNKNWLSKWFNTHNYLFLLHEDILIRNYISNILKNINIFFSKCIIKRTVDKTYIYLNIFTKKRKTSNNHSLINTKQIKQMITSLTKLTNNHVVLIIKPTNVLDAQLLAQYISRKLEMRLSFQVTFNKIISNIKILNASMQKQSNQSLIKGIRIQCSGRPNGNDMANIQWFKYGQIPLHSFKEKIDYSHTTALTKYGICGVKVWISYN